MELYNRNADVNGVKERKWFCVNANENCVVECNVDMKRNVDVFNALWRIINKNKNECLYYCNTSNNSNNSNNVINCLNIEKAISQLISQLNILLIVIIFAITFMLYKFISSLLLPHIIAFIISIFISLILSLITYIYLSSFQEHQTNNTIETDNTTVSKWIQTNQISFILRISAFSPCTNIHNNNIHLFTSFILNNPTLLSFSESMFPNIITKRISTFQNDYIIITDTYDTTPLISYIIQSSTSNITHMKLLVYLNISFIIDNNISLDIINKVLTYLHTACVLYERESFDNLIQLNNTYIETQINDINNFINASEWSEYVLLCNCKGINVMYRTFTKCFGFNVQFTLVNVNVNSIMQKVIESCKCVSFELMNAENEYVIDIQQSNVSDGFYTYVNGTDAVNVYMENQNEHQIRIYCLNGNNRNNNDNKEYYSGVILHSNVVNANNVVVVTYFEYCAFMNTIDSNIDGEVVSKEHISKYINLFNYN